MTQAARDNGDALARAGKALIARGVDGYAGPDTDAFIDEVGRHHAAGALYREATAEAIALCRLPGASDALIAGIYRNFVWTHFVVKLLMTASPLHAIQYFHSHFDIGELQAALAPGSAIISCFHCTGYPLVALGLAASPVAPLISKARVDFLEKSPARIGERVVYLSDRSAPVQLTRALKQGIPAWIMLDVVLPGMRVVPTSFLGGTLDVSAGMDAIARLSGRPCLPLFWDQAAGRTRLRAGAPIHHAGAGEGIIQEFVRAQAAFVAEQPVQWLEWYAVLDRAPAVRAQVKLANDAIWDRLSPALAAGGRA